MRSANGRIWIVALALLMCSAQSFGQDEDAFDDQAYIGSVTVPCIHDASFDAFTKSLKNVVRRRDTFDLLALAIDDVQNRFPFELGKSEMMLNWYLAEQGKKSRVWPTLRAMLKRPCRQDQTGRRWLDDGAADSYYMFVEKNGDYWMIAGLSGEPD